MTAAEFAQLVVDIRDRLYTNFRANLPVECEIEKRFILPGENKDSDWVADLRNPVTKKVRKLVMLFSEMGVGQLGQTHGARNFAPSAKINFELYHEFTPVNRDDNNSEDDFIRDCAIINYTLGQSRPLAGSRAVIETANLRMGIRPSRTQTLHKAVGQIFIRMIDVRYDELP